VGCVSRYRPQGTLDDCGDLIVIDTSRPTGASLVQKPLHTILQKAPPPFANPMFMHAQFGSDNFAWDAIGAAQDDPAPLRHRARYTPPPNLPFQIFTFFRLQNQSRRGTANHVCHVAISLQETTSYNDAYFSSR
jgi:hypothetical protein